MNETSVNHTKTSPAINYGRVLGKDVLFYLPVKLFPAITGLLSIYILTRKLAPGEYGIYSVVITAALLLTQLSSAWLTSAVLYIYPDYSKEHQAVFQNQVLKIQGIAAVPAVVVVYIALLMTTHVPSLALAGSVMMVLQIFQGLMQTFLQSTRQVISQAVSVGLQSLTQLTVLYSLVFVAQGKEFAAIVAVSAGYAAAITALAIHGRSSNRSEHAQIDSRELFNRLFKYGMPMCIWFFATQFYTIGDRLLLKVFNVNDALGQYASFRDLATGCAGFLTMPLLMASHPIIMAMWKEGRDRAEVEQLISRNMSVLTLMFIPLLVMIDVCGKELITPILGQKYLLDTRIMLTVVGSIYLGCIAIYVQKGLEVTGKTLPMAKIALVVVFFSLLANSIIIKTYGVMGTSLMVIVSNIIYIFIIRHYTSKILTPRIPKQLIAVISVWVITVETICSKSGGYFTAIPAWHNYINFFIIATASLGLFVWGGRTFLLKIAPSAVSVVSGLKK